MLFQTLLLTGTLGVATALSIPRSESAHSVTHDAAFQKTMVDKHNAFRLEHNAQPLTWNKTLADYAADWADKCIFEHSVSLFISVISHCLSYSILP